MQFYSNVIVLYAIISLAAALPQSSTSFINHYIIFITHHVTKLVGLPTMMSCQMMAAKWKDSNDMDYITRFGVLVTDYLVSLMIFLYYSYQP